MSIATSTAISTQPPLLLTSTLTSTFVDTTMEAGLGALAAISLALFLATLFMLIKRNTAPSRTPAYGAPLQGASAQVPADGPPAAFCMHCGTNLGPGDGYCRKCGSKLP